MMFCVVSDPTPTMSPAAGVTPAGGSARAGPPMTPTASAVAVMATVRAAFFGMCMFHSSWGTVFTRRRATVARAVRWLRYEISMPSMNTASHPRDLPGSHQVTIS